MKPFEFTPVGTVSCEARNRYDAPRQGVLNEDVRSVVRLREGIGMEQAVADLAGFDRIWLVYVFHLNEHWKPKVHVPRGRKEKIGVFATRAPYRPNPIGISCVRLLEVRGLELDICESDLLDGTPILDIKPYLAYADAFPDASTGWLEQAENERFSVMFTAPAEQHLNFLYTHGAGDVHGFVTRQLEYAPLDDRSKRVRRGSGDGEWILAWRTWRVQFFCDEEERCILVHRLFSGYSGSEMIDPEDPYHDKELHIAFRNEFRNNAHTG